MDLEHAVRRLEADKARLAKDLQQAEDKDGARGGERGERERRQREELRMLEGQLADARRSEVDKVRPTRPSLLPSLPRPCQHTGRLPTAQHITAHRDAPMQSLTSIPPLFHPMCRRLRR